MLSMTVRSILAFGDTSQMLAPSFAHTTDSPYRAIISSKPKSSAL